MTIFVGEKRASRAGAVGGERGNVPYLALMGKSQGSSYAAKEIVFVKSYSKKERQGDGNRKSEVEIRKVVQVCARHL